MAILGRLADGVSIEASREEVAAIFRRAEAPLPGNFNEFVVNLSLLWFFWA